MRRGIPWIVPVRSVVLSVAIQLSWEPTLRTVTLADDTSENQKGNQRTVRYCLIGEGQHSLVDGLRKALSRGELADCGNSCSTPTRQIVRLIAERAAAPAQTVRVRAGGGSSRYRLSAAALPGAALLGASTPAAAAPASDCTPSLGRGVTAAPADRNGGPICPAGSTSRASRLLAAALPAALISGCGLVPSVPAEAAAAEAPSPEDLSWARSSPVDPAAAVAWVL